MNILVIFTGGTIGSSQKEGWISPSDAPPKQLIQDFLSEKKESGIHFTTLSPYEILSENLSAKELNTLRSVIEEESQKGYDGIVVTHGTDTLQFTAAALDFTLSKRVPVLLVSAAYPLEDRRSNGQANFHAAVDFIKSKPQAGVYVSYQNEGKTLVDIHFASRLLSHAECSADLYSVGGAYASVDTQNGAVLTHIPYFQPVPGVGKVDFCTTSPILSLDCYPEKVYPEKIRDYRALLLTPYHSGTLNTAAPSFQSFCLAAKKSGIPLFVASGAKGTSYASAKDYERLGITPVPMTKIATLVKCWLAVSLGKNGEQLKDFLLAPLSNELLD